MNSKKVLLSVAAALVFVALLVYGSRRTHFRWDILAAQMHYVHWSNILIGVLLIYGAFVVRAFRWTVFLRPTKRLAPLYLLGTQVIGFTAVALLGRVADLARPYLVARRAKLPVAPQIAIWTVERMFDFASMATIVSLALLLSPDGATMPHRAQAVAGAKSLLSLAALLVAFTVSVRLSGEAIAAAIERGPLGKFGAAIAAKIRSFREGLVAISSASALLQAAALSLLMWAMISGAYLMTVRAFASSAALASMTLGRTVILMAASMVGSAFPVPVAAWFTQVIALQITLVQLFNVPQEIALGCGAGLTFVTFLAIIPVGLVWSRFEHISLRRVAEESEHDAGEISSSARA
ncbi:MAG TPA: lysylphosphatidylglycerol synthase domain-containing protein [Acidobacteriaceae bacterium]|nr:lysylphosphatidylglycerol synthase domain-containing protein [Acidobacteriaceae bacterium]